MSVMDKGQIHPKAYWRGSHRLRSPRETVAMYSAFMPMMGITRLANVTGLDSIGLPVYVAVRPNSRGLSVSQGKGVDADSAKASALMESIETWHAERIECPLRYDSVTSLRRTASVVDVLAMPRRQGSTTRLDAPLLWVEGHDLLHREPCWVPFDAVSTNFVLPPGPPSPFLMSTNGLASGNDLTEAIVHGLCEVIERDAISLQRARLPALSESRRLDLTTVDDECCGAALDLIKGAGALTAAWDITSDIGIAAYEVMIVEPVDPGGWRTQGMFSGYGCHLEPGIALHRALSEAIQSRLTMITGSRDDIFHRDYAHNSHADDIRRVVASIEDARPTRTFQEQASRSTPTFEGDLTVILERLRAVGMDRAVAVDLSRPDIGVPVVKVVVPHLECSGLVPGFLAGTRASRAAEERAT